MNYGIDAISLSVPAARPRMMALRHAKAPSATFRKTLNAIPSAASLHTVRSGENLSCICEKALKKAGMSHSTADIYQAVQKVATTNRLADPDFITVGQRLNLSAILPEAQLQPSQSAARAAAALPRGGRIHMGLERAQSLADRLKALFTDQRANSITNSEDVRFTPTPMFDGPVGITSQYGVRKDPFTGQRDMHDGVDFAAPMATPIKSFAAGTVSFSGWQSGYGKCVVIKHVDGMETLYAHNSENVVKVGQRVTGDSVIARVGSTGNSTGPHLHFEVRKDGKAIDPSPFLAQSLQVAKAL